LKKEKKNAIIRSKKKEVTLKTMIIKSPQQKALLFIGLLSLILGSFSFADIHFPKKTIGGIFEWKQVEKKSGLVLGLGYGIANDLNFIYQFRRANTLPKSNTDLNYSKKETFSHGLYLSKLLLDSDITIRSWLGMEHMQETTRINQMINDEFSATDKFSDQLNVAVKGEFILSTFKSFKPLLQIETRFEFPNMNMQSLSYSIGTYIELFENMNTFLKVNTNDQIYSVGFTFHHDPFEKTKKITTPIRSKTFQKPKRHKTPDFWPRKAAKSNQKRFQF